MDEVFKALSETKADKTPSPKEEEEEEEVKKGSAEAKPYDWNIKSNLSLDLSAESSSREATPTGDSVSSLELALNNRDNNALLHQNKVMPCQHRQLDCYLAALILLRFGSVRKA